MKCFICGDPRDHDGIPHGEATGDGKTRVDHTLDQMWERLRYTNQGQTDTDDVPALIATLRAINTKAKAWSQDWETNYDSGMTNRCGDELQSLLYDGLIRKDIKA